MMLRGNSGMSTWGEMPIGRQTCAWVKSPSEEFWEQDGEEDALSKSE